MAEVVSTGVSHMCDNSTVSVNETEAKKIVEITPPSNKSHINCCIIN